MSRRPRCHALNPILFDDHDRPAAEAARNSIVAKATRSEQARQKAASKRPDDDLPVHSFQSLLTDLATITRNTMAMADSPEHSFLLYPQLTPFSNAPSTCSPSRSNCSQ
jgi:hypothetical protein